MADKSFDRDDLVAEIQRELGVRVERSDPILAAGVVNDFMLRRTVDMLIREIKAQSVQHIAAIAQTPKVAEKAAIEMLNRTGDWADERIKQAGIDAAAHVNAASEAAVASFQALIQAEAQKIQAEVQKIEKLGACFRVAASVIGIVAGIAATLWLGEKIAYLLPVSLNC